MARKYLANMLVNLKKIFVKSSNLQGTIRENMAKRVDYMSSCLMKLMPFVDKGALIVHLQVYLCLILGSKDAVVNQLLTNLDGVEALNNIIMIGMTNRKDLLDEAILRPGRLEVHIEIGIPD